MDNPKEKTAVYKIEDMREGLKFTFCKVIEKKDIDDFIILSGDISPMHVSDQFARSRGFAGRVVHGALLISYLSKVMGVHFPGENCLLQGLNLKFLSPTYINDTVEFVVTVDHLSIGANAAILDVAIKNVKSRVMLVKG